MHSLKSPFTSGTVTNKLVDIPLEILIWHPVRSQNNTQLTAFKKSSRSDSIWKEKQPHPDCCPCSGIRDPQNKTHFFKRLNNAHTFVRVQVMLPSSDSCHSNIGKILTGLYQVSFNSYTAFSSLGAIACEFEGVATFFASYQITIGTMKFSLKKKKKSNHFRVSFPLASRKAVVTLLQCACDQGDNPWKTRAQ